MILEEMEAPVREANKTPQTKPEMMKVAINAEQVQFRERIGKLMGKMFVLFVLLLITWYLIASSGLDLWCYAVFLHPSSSCRVVGRSVQVLCLKRQTTRENSSPQAPYLHNVLTTRHTAHVWRCTTWIWICLCNIKTDEEQDTLQDDASVFELIIRSFKTCIKTLYFRTRIT